MPALKEESDLYFFTNTDRILKKKGTDNSAPLTNTNYLKSKMLYALFLSTLFCLMQTVTQL